MTRLVPSVVCAVAALGMLGACEQTNAACVDDARCELACPSGYCNFYCDDDAICAGGCEGGECVLSCTGQATCAFSCPTGNCTLFCLDSADCAFDCDGCRVECGANASCR